MKATPVQAHQVASISGARSSDGQFGLIRFVRAKPMPDGQTDVWMAVPTNLLPYLATVAVQALPQPQQQGGTVPHVLSPKQALVGVGAGGEIVLSIALEKGATLSYRLERKQAETLIAGLQRALKPSGTAAASRPGSGKNGKAKG